MFKPCDQIAYIPHHADGDLSHPDVQFGFVTSVKGDTVFCRYFYTNLTGASAKHNGELRTRSCSEGCEASLLVHHQHKPQSVIDALKEMYDSTE